MQDYIKKLDVTARAMGVPVSELEAIVELGQVVAYASELLAGQRESESSTNSLGHPRRETPTGRSSPKDFCSSHTWGNVTKKVQLVSPVAPAYSAKS